MPKIDLSLLEDLEVAGPKASPVVAEVSGKGVEESGRKRWDPFESKKEFFGAYGGKQAGIVESAEKAMTTTSRTISEDYADIARRQREGEIGAFGAFVRQLPLKAQEIVLPVSRAIGEVVSPVVEPVVTTLAESGQALLDIPSKAIEPFLKKVIGEENIGAFQKRVDNMTEGEKRDLFNFARTLEVVADLSGVKITGQLVKQSLDKLGKEGIKQAFEEGFAKGTKFIEPVAEKIHGGIEKGTALTEKIVEKVETKLKLTEEEIERKIDDQLLRVTQGVREDKKQYKKAIETIGFENLKEIDNYLDFKKVTETKSRSIKKTQDTYLEKYTEKFLPEKTNVKDEVKGTKTKVETNFVQRALNDLESLYGEDVLGDNAAFARIKDIQSRFKNEGLTVKEINDLSVEYGRDFGNKAFKLSGEAKNKVGLNRYENTRKGLKRTRDQLLKDDGIAKELDNEMHSLIATERALQKVSETTDKAIKKFNERGLMDKLGNMVGRLVEMVPIVSGGLDFTRSLFQKLFIHSDLGNKTPNSFKINQMLNKRIVELEKMLKMPDDNLVAKVKRMAKKVLESGNKPLQDLIEERIKKPKAKEKQRPTTVETNPI